MTYLKVEQLEDGEDVTLGNVVGNRITKGVIPAGVDGDGKARLAKNVSGMMLNHDPQTHALIRECLDQLKRVLLHLQIMTGEEV